MEELEVAPGKWNKIPLTGVPMLVSSLDLSNDQWARGKAVLDGNSGQLSSLYSVTSFIFANVTHTHFQMFFILLLLSILSYSVLCTFLYIIRKNKGEISLFSFSPSLTHTHTHLKPKMTRREHCISELSKISEKL